MKLTRWQRRAPWILGASVTLYLAVTAANFSALFVDLHVYALGGEALQHSGSLYDVFFTDAFGGGVRFIYPPFAAMLFYPLHWMPFPVLALCWTALSIVALYGVVRISQLMVGADNARSVMLWTAGVLWLEPVRSTLNLGQLGVYLTLVVLYAAYTSRWWVSGLLIGIAGGVKLSPMITCVYFVGMRQWGRAAACRPSRNSAGVSVT